MVTSLGMLNPSFLFSQCPPRKPSICAQKALQNRSRFDFRLRRRAERLPINSEDAQDLGLFRVRHARFAHDDDSPARQGQARRDQGVGPQDATDRLPFSPISLLLEATTHPAQEVISEHADKNVTIHPIFFLMEDPGAAGASRKLHDAGDPLGGHGGEFGFNPFESPLRPRATALAMRGLSTSGMSASPREATTR